MCILIRKERNAQHGLCNVQAAASGDFSIFLPPLCRIPKKNIFFDSAIMEVEMEVGAMKGAAWQGCQALGTGKCENLTWLFSVLLCCGNSHIGVVPDHLIPTSGSPTCWKAAASERTKSTVELEVAFITALMFQCFVQEMGFDNLLPNLWIENRMKPEFLR